MIFFLTWVLAQNTGDWPHPKILSFLGVYTLRNIKIERWPSTLIPYTTCVVGVGWGGRCMDLNGIYVCVWWGGGWLG